MQRATTPRLTMAALVAASLVGPPVARAGGDPGPARPAGPGTVRAGGDPGRAHPAGAPAAAAVPAAGAPAAAAAPTAGAAAATAAAAAAPAPAGPGARAAGVVLVTGGGAERQREIVAQAIEAAVRDAGWRLPPKPLTRSQADGVLACLDAKQPASCIPAALGLARVFVVMVEDGQADNGAPLVVLTGKALLVDPPSTAIRQQHCERCASNDLTAASAELAKIVLRDLALRAGTTIADLRSDPDGAEIVLDGRRVGVTNAKLNTYPGKHVVRFEKPGYLAETRELVAVDDQSVLVAVTLRSSAPVGSAASTRRSRLLPVALLGASGALLALGVTGFYYGTQGGPDERYRYPRATPIGVGATVAAVGAAGAGVYLLWAGSRSSAPAVQATAGGAVLGWGGTFR